MTKKLHVELLSESAQGNFKLVSTLISNMNEFDQCLAAKVVIESCRVLTKNAVSTCNINEEDLYKLLVKCISVMETVDDALLMGYLQSMYYIIKFLIEKKSFKLIAEMEDMLMPKFINTTYMSPKLSKLYTALYALLHNTVAELLQSETPIKDNQTLCYLCILSLQMKLYTTSSIVLLANTACSFFKTSNFVKMDINLQYNCYLKVLQLIKLCNDTQENHNKDSFCALMRILEVAIKNLFKENQFIKIKEFIKIIHLEIGDLGNIQCYVELFSILKCASESIVDLKDSKEISDLLRNNFEVCFKSLKCFTVKYGITEELQKVCTVLYIILFYTFELYSRADSKVWNACIIKETEAFICEVLAGIGQIISKTQMKCVSCSNCKINTDLYTSTCTTVLIGKLLKKSLDNDTSICKVLVTRVAQYLETCCKFIAILKTAKCSRWKFAWSETAVIIYNIAVKLYAIKHNECNNYFLLLVKNVSFLEDTETSSSVFNFDVVSTSLRCLADINIHACQFQKALMFSAVQILISPDAERKFQIWISAKIKSKKNDTVSDDSIQETTILCVLEDCKNEIQDFCCRVPNKLDKSVKQKLLLLELDQYKMLWPSRIPMMTVFKKLYKIADTLTLVKVLIQTWGEDITTAHDEILMLLKEIMIRFKSDIKKNRKNQVEMQIYLALLYVMYYYYQSRKVKQKTVEEINQTAVSEQQPALPHEEPKNPNDECDLVSSYESLKLEEHMKTIKYLNKALRIFKTFIPQCTPQLLVNLLNEYNVFSSIVKVAQEFTLHCHTLQSVQTWFVSLSISKLSNNKLHALQSISSIIEVANMNSEIISKLLNEAEALEFDIRKHDLSSEMWKILTVYHISKSVMLLQHQKLEEGYEEYKQAFDCFVNVENEELLRIRLDFLHVQYLQLPCNLGMEGHDVISLAKFSGVLGDIVNFIKTSGTYSPLARTVLFEINQYVAEVYKSMCLPREVRCYCRNIITFAQEEVVPLRTAYFLAYLAYADLLSVRLDDCQVKLNDMSEILCLGNKRFSQSQQPEREDDVLNKADDVSNLIESFAEIMLECPVNNTHRQSLTGSPILVAKPFKMPSFVNHSFECDCFYCMSMEYKQLVTEYIHLEAKLHVHYNNTTAANICFGAALQLYKHMNDRNETFKRKIVQLLSWDPFHDIKDILRETHCALLLSYGYNLLRLNDTAKAKCFNEQLVNLISEIKYNNLYLYNEALAQKLFITYFTLEDVNTNQPNLLIEIDLAADEDNKYILRTPENRQTKIVFPTSWSPRPDSPPKRRLIRKKCDFSENKVNNTKEDNVLKMTKLPFIIHTSPDDKIVDTKLAVVTEKDENSKTNTKWIYKTPIPKTTKKKVVLQEIPVIEGSNNNCSTEQDITAVIPSSPNAYTPKAVLASSVLQCRTKLLTKKLAKSTIKKQSEENKKDSISNNIEAENNRLKRDVCKNLMSELCAAENHVLKRGTNKKRIKVQTENTTGTSLIPLSTRVTRARKNK